MRVKRDLVMRFDRDVGCGRDVGDICFARPGKTNRKSLTLSRLRGGPLEIKRVNATSEHVKTELVTLDAGAKYQINVFLDSTNAPEGDFGDTLVVETDSPNQPKIEVPVYAKVRSKPVQ